MIEAISHRGSRTRHPENTIGAVLGAVDEGANGIEIDVHSTRDGEIVVHHDFFPRGQVPDRKLATRPIADLTLAELRLFDIGHGEQIPSLQDLVAALDGRAKLYVEIKGRGCEERLAATLPQATTRVAVHSFDHRGIGRMAKLAPSIPRGVLQGSYMVDNCLALESASATDLWQHFELIDAALVREVHDCGARVIAWTVNEARDWERLADDGVDAICTDNVARLIRWRDGRLA
ncbi:MAG: glycerophosphodiester phosphodiesterase [Gemmatimonadaceae bacterium]